MLLIQCRFIVDTLLMIIYGNHLHDDNLQVIHFKSCCYEQVMSINYPLFKPSIMVIYISPATTSYTTYLLLIIYILFHTERSYEHYEDHMQQK